MSVSSTLVNRATVAGFRSARMVAARLGLPTRWVRQAMPRSSWAWLTGEPYPDVPLATEDDAMGLPPFGRGVALLANAVAGTEWRAVRWDPTLGVFQRRPDQPQILTNTISELGTVWNYRWAAVEDLVLYGNHFALYGEPDSAWSYLPKWILPVAADQVWILQDPETEEWTWVVNGVEIDPGSMLHASAGVRSGEILGRGVLRQYAPWLGGAIAAETHAGAYFAGAALPPAVLQSPSIVTQEQADDLKLKWREMTSTREPVILPNGVTLTPIVSNAEQAQLVESRTWNAEAVAMMLGIPSYKLGLPGTSMTYQNIESADIEFVRDSVDRYAAPLSAAFSKYLMPAGTIVAWDYAGRMRADQKTTAEVLTTYTDKGVLLVDEARAVLSRPPLEQATQEGSTPAGTPELTPEVVTTDV